MNKKLINTEIPKLISQIENLTKSLENISNTLENMYSLFLEIKEKENERPRR